MGLIAPDLVIYEDTPPSDIRGRPSVVSASFSDPECLREDFVSQERVSGFLEKGLASFRGSFGKLLDCC